MLLTHINELLCLKGDLVDKGEGKFEYFWKWSFRRNVANYFIPNNEDGLE